MSMKLYDQANYVRPTKEQQQLDQQAKNDPLKDGFTRSEMVHHQPSEIKNMEDGGQYSWDAEHENKDIERTR